MSLKTLEQFKEIIIENKKTQKNKKALELLDKSLEEIKISKCVDLDCFIKYVKEKGIENMEDFEKALFCESSLPSQDSGTMLYLALDSLLCEFVMCGKIFISH